MKRRIVYIAVTVITLLLIDRGLFAILDTCHRNVVLDSPQGQVAWYLRNGKRFDVVVFGASKTKHGVVTTRIGDGWFNLARGGMREPYALCALSLLVESGLTPRGVVLGVNPQHFYTGGAESEPVVATSPQYFKYYYPQNRVVKECIDRISIFEPSKFLFSSYRFNPDAINLLVGYIRALRGAPSRPFDGLVSTQGFVALSGFDTPEAGENWYQQVMGQFAEQRLNRRVEKFAPEKLYYLNRFVTVCRENNIQVTLVVLPQLLNFDPEYHAQGLRVLEELDEKYDDVGFINLASGAFAPSLDWSCWSDRFHLSEKGAEKLTDALVARLKSQSSWKPLLEASGPQAASRF